MKVAAFGELLWDVVEGQNLIGGAPFNFAAHAVQCGIGAAIVSALGKDNLGERALKEVKRLNVESQFLQFADKPTGTVNVTLKKGQPSYQIIEKVAYDFIDSLALDIGALKTYDHFYFGSLSQRNVVSRASLKHIIDQCQFGTIFLDVNLRQNYYSVETLDFSLRRCTILKLNEDEVKILSKLLFFKLLKPKAFSTTILEYFPNIQSIIVTLGGKGCLVYNQSEFVRIHSQPIQVEDTIGAGDSFSAAFLSHYVQNKNVKQAAQFANRIGGFVASSKGAIPSYHFSDFL